MQTRSAHASSLAATKLAQQAGKLTLARDSYQYVLRVKHPDNGWTEGQARDLLTLQEFARLSLAQLPKVKNISESQP